MAHKAPYEEFNFFSALYATKTKASRAREVKDYAKPK